MKKWITFFTLVMILCGCGEPQHPCFDQQLYKNSKDDVCPTDCPGVHGCDGEHYCNECEAARVGIKAQ